MGISRAKVDKILYGTRRGPAQGDGNNGKGPSFAGIVEETPALRISWIVWACKMYGAAVEPIVNSMSFFGVGLSCERVKSGFGYRYYWLCPRCKQRTEIIFALRQGISHLVGCKRRECLHLGYLSQTTKPGSVYRVLAELFGRPNSRYDIPIEVQECLKEALQPFAKLHNKEIADNVKVDNMEVKKTIHQTQRVKKCSDGRVSLFFDLFDEWLKQGLSPRESLEKAAESYAEVFHYTKR